MRSAFRSVRLVATADTPFRASHAIYVLENAAATYDRIDAVPESLRVRTLSIRAFDADHMMVDADLVEGRELEALIERMLAEPTVAYLHAHYARRGCYAARIGRAPSLSPQAKGRVGEGSRGAAARGAAAW